jgi:hypothetical protein
MMVPLEHVVQSVLAGTRQRQLILSAELRRRIDTQRGRPTMQQDVGAGGHTPQSPRPSKGIPADSLNLSAAIC